MSTSGENDIFFTDEATAEGVGIRGGFLCLKARGKGCRGIKVGGIVLDESERHVGEGKRVRSLDTGSPILQCSNQAPGRGGSATILHRVSADGEIFFSAVTAHIGIRRRFSQKQKFAIIFKGKKVELGRVGIASSSKAGSSSSSTGPGEGEGASREVGGVGGGGRRRRGGGVGHTLVIFRLYWYSSRGECLLAAVGYGTGGLLYCRLYEQTLVPVASSIPRTPDSGTIDEFKVLHHTVQTSSWGKAETK